MANEKRTVEQFLEAIKNSGGEKQTIARRLGLHRHSIDNYQKKYKSIDEAITIEREMLLDVAESNIFAAIERGDVDISKWFLSLRGRNRGYTIYKKCRKCRI